MASTKRSTALLQCLRNGTCGFVLLKNCWCNTLAHFKLLQFASIELNGTKLLSELQCHRIHLLQVGAKKTGGGQSLHSAIVRIPVKVQCQNLQQIRSEARCPMRMSYCSLLAMHGVETCCKMAENTESLSCLTVTGGDASVTLRSNSSVSRVQQAFRSAEKVTFRCRCTC